MPEIWLRYGTTDVVLDIKFENLASQISSTFQMPLELDLKTAITSGVPLTDRMLFLGLSGSKAAAKIIMMLAEEAHTRGFSFTIDVPHKIASSLRANLTGIETISINRINYQSLNERMAKFQSTIIVSTVAYDPLFGFAGAPTTLLRNLLADQMAEAFSRSPLLQLRAYRRYLLNLWLTVTMWWESISEASRKRLTKQLHNFSQSRL